jgi:hypothetical protein
MDEYTEQMNVNNRVYDIFTNELKYNDNLFNNLKKENYLELLNYTIEVNDALKNTNKDIVNINYQLFDDKNPVNEIMIYNEYLNIIKKCKNILNELILDLDLDLDLNNINMEKNVRVNLNMKDKSVFEIKTLKMLIDVCNDIFGIMNNNVNNCIDLLKLPNQQPPIPERAPFITKAINEANAPINEADAVNTRETFTPKKPEVIDVNIETCVTDAVINEADAPPPPPETPEVIDVNIESCVTEEPLAVGGAIPKPITKKRRRRRNHRKTNKKTSQNIFTSLFSTTG